ncbi:Polyphosphoinositide phosphatase [Oryzias melastigma]|uniref:Polyphosphoinositide phosphatase n=1 Tax=Oryzias melastigma TaxID=30732 RepID=A0A834FNM4_ORYME|nr:Polyphosphoinositide phosphatase [Oryzias melastigma]
MDSNLSELPAEKDVLIYKRFAHLGENQHMVERSERINLANILYLEPVSQFPEDSIYGVCPPQVDRDSREVFESHVMTGRGHVRALCREDMLMYREYVKNRYM